MDAKVSLSVEIIRLVVAVTLTLPVSGDRPKPVSNSSFDTCTPVYNSPRLSAAGVAVMEVGMLICSARMPAFWSSWAPKRAMRLAPNVAVWVLSP